MAHSAHPTIIRKSSIVPLRNKGPAKLNGRPSTFKSDYKYSSPTSASSLLCIRLIATRPLTTIELPSAPSRSGTKTSPANSFTLSISGINTLLPKESSKESPLTHPSAAGSRTVGGGTGTTDAVGGVIAVETAQTDGRISTLEETVAAHGATWFGTDTVVTFADNGGDVADDSE